MTVQQAPLNEPFTRKKSYWLMSSFQDITFLTRMSISRIEHFAPDASQYSGDLVEVINTITGGQRLQITQSLYIH